MEAREVKAILEEANVQESTEGFCAISASGLFHQAKETIKDAYKNSAYFGGFIEEVGMQDVFDLGIADPKLIRKIKAYTMLNKSWCVHAREFLSIPDEDLGYFLAKKNIDTQSTDRFCEKYDNVVQLRARKENVLMDCKGIRKFLKVKGFKISKQDTVSRRDVKFIVMEAKKFIEDAYENASMARDIAIEILSQSPEILATMNSRLLDHLSEFAAKNDAWMISTKKSLFNQGSVSGIPTEVTGAKASRNVVTLYSRHAKERRAVVRESEVRVEIHRP